MKSTDPQAEKSRNSTCRYLGHEWKRTAASNYRICQRDQCRAAERLQNGQWVSVLSKRSPHQHVMPQQSSLF